jgi:hypothetical protein
MATPILTDVFKFVAVRPAQLVPDSDTATTFIRDARAGTADGRKHLTQLGRVLAQRDTALGRWEELDLGKLEPLADSYATLVRGFESTAPAAPVPDRDAAMAAAGVSVNGGAAGLTETAWDALYTAHATGADAGPRLEIPMAALRVLHFAATSPAAPAPADALAMLHARPLIPAAVGDFAEPGKPAAVVPVEPKAPGGTRAMHALIEDLAASRGLLDATREAPALALPELQPVRTTSPAVVEHRSDGGLQTMRLSNIPKLHAVLPSRLSPVQSKLLSNLSIGADTPVPVATRKLQDKVTTLTTQALALRDNPDFAAMVHQATIDNLVLADIANLFGPPQPLPVSGIGSSPDVDMRQRIRPLGIGDLKVVKQKLLAYLPGEVAHIENVLKGESKNREFRVLNRLETTLVESLETVEQHERDTQTTDRFELKKESESTIKEDMSVQAGLTVTGSYGPVTMTAHGDFAYSTSKSESTKSSANFGRDVVDRSVSKIQKTTKTERTTRTFQETEETDSHGLDNKLGTGHVIGVYRWVDKKYSAQIYNYGRRMMLEFVVPEPSAFFTASQMATGKPVVDAVEPAPFVDAANKPLTPAAFTPSTYRIFASRYNAAGVNSPPQEWIYMSTAFEEHAIDNGHTVGKVVKELVIPDGYRMYFYDAQVSALWTNYPQLSLQIGDTRHHILHNSGALAGMTTEIGTSLASTVQPTGVLAVSVVGYDINAYTVNISALCSYMPWVYEKWQQETYDKTFTAYKAMKTEYDQKVKQAQAQAMGIQIAGRNPGLNREIIARELKKHCLTMLTGMHFNGFHAMTNPSDQPTHIPEIDPYLALDEGRFSQFFEQAFEWEQLTYLFYPYFWARKSRWITLSNQQDPDPAFMQFLQAGAVRVVLPVSRAYNDAIAYFLQSKKAAVADRIWRGGDVPTIDDPLYKSIADELRAQTDDLAGAVPEGDPWEFTVPTTLVWLQSDGSLPAFA